MPALLHLLFALIFDQFKSRRRLEIENLYLRHQLNIAMRKAPQRLRLRGADGSYGQVFTNRLRSMGIRDRPTAPRSPWQNAYVERFIGTLRRECLDHVLIFGERHLRRVLTTYSAYYNETRMHLGLDKDTPLPRPAQPFGTIVSVPILSGLHHCYART